MRYRVLCDENVAVSTVAELSDHGIEAVHVTDRLDPGSSDSAVAEVAREDDFLLLTNDDDFLDETEFPDVTVLYFPDNSVPGHVLARRVARLSSWVSDPTDLGRVTFPTD